MKSYVLSYSSSGEVSEIFADSDDAAISQATALIGGEPIVADDWDADGSNDDNEPCKRILFWASEEDAEGDSGAKSVAQLSTVERD